MISVFVAAVGVLGTALGAALSAFFAARSEGRRQGVLERQQVRQELMQKDAQLRELRLEHLRWRRERRQAAYLELLTALSAADRANQQYFRELRAGAPPMPVDDARLTEIRRLFKDCEQILYMVALEGPADVAEVAQHLIEHFGALVAAVRQYAEAQSAAIADLAEDSNTVDMTGQSFMTTQKKFVSTARDALDEIVGEP
ncbi:hypothetical protein [Nocardia sp. BMG111209]|uniref:hypothetical protein n=1 Tax=Nocardia sp. BMG111209 TaxID=1160137 RepID=UPI0003A3C627|nr:hypothetical protein [Nocardia sp. BMG111209]